MSLLSEDLRTEIAKSLNFSFRVKTKYTFNQIPDHKIIHSHRVGIAGTSVTFYELDLVADEFYVSSHYILVIRNHSMYLYRYSTAFTVKLYKKIEVSYLLYKSPMFKKKERIFLYKIYLDLLEANVYRYEAWFEAIVTFLCMDEVEEIYEYANGIGLFYRNGKIKYFDSYLNPIGQEALIPLEDELGDETHKYIVTKRALEMHRTGSTFVSKRKMGRIQQHVALYNLLFLLTDKTIVIAKFSKD